MKSITRNQFMPMAQVQKKSDREQKSEILQPQPQFGASRSGLLMTAALAASVLMNGCNWNMTKTKPEASEKPPVVMTPTEELDQSALPPKADDPHAERRAELRSLTQYYGFDEVFIPIQRDAVKELKYLEYVGDAKEGWPQSISVEGTSKSIFQPGQQVTLKDGTVITDDVLDAKGKEKSLNAKELRAKLLLGKVSHVEQYPISQKNSDVVLINGTRFSYSPGRTEDTQKTDALLAKLPVKDAGEKLVKSHSAFLEVAQSSPHAWRMAFIEDDSVPLATGKEKDVAGNPIQPKRGYFSIHKDGTDYYLPMASGSYHPYEQIVERFDGLKAIGKESYEINTANQKEFDELYKLIGALEDLGDARGNKGVTDIDDYRYSNGHQKIMVNEYHGPIVVHGPGEPPKIQEIDKKVARVSQELSLAEASQKLANDEVLQVHFWPASRLYELTLKNTGGKAAEDAAKVFTYVQQPDFPDRHHELASQIKATLGIDSIPEKQTVLSSPDEFLTLAKQGGAFWTMERLGPPGQEQRKSIYLSLLKGEHTYLLKPPGQYDEGENLLHQLMDLAQDNTLKTDIIYLEDSRFSDWGHHQSLLRHNAYIRDNFTLDKWNVSGEWRSRNDSSFFHGDRPTLPEDIPLIVAKDTK